MRDMFCGEIKKIHVNKKIFLCGWINQIRNFKNVIFMDLKDHTGIIQVLFNKKSHSLLSKAKKLKNEFCIQIYGTVQLRNEKNINLNIPTGTIEILAISLLILNSSKPLPLDNNKNNKEETRLKYRYLDLRRPQMFNIFKLRSKIIYWIHKFMYFNKFINVDTPMLTKSTPEGARDYIIPSRNHPKKFYALPQSPQLFKQLIMISGFDRYYQIAKCFRDEDLRSDRQPEFTQLDIEMSFVNSIQIRNFMENMICQLWYEIKKVKLSSFSVINYHESIQNYGTDKPDLRNPMKMFDINHLLDKKFCKFIYEKYQKKTSRIVAFTIPCTFNLDKSQIIFYKSYLQKKGIKNPIIILIKNEKLKILQNKKNMNNFFCMTVLNQIIKYMNINNDNIIFIMGNIIKTINKSFHALRTKLNTDFKSLYLKVWKPVWIIDFPLFIINHKKEIISSHHPFTAPKNNNSISIKNDPTKLLSDSYDMVINGYEIGGGSVRINNIALQKKIFSILNLDKITQNEKFGFFLNALQFGTPPHAGIAFGLDRIIMLLSDTNDIKDVIAFPKTSEASCLTTNAPTILSSKKLKEVHIKNL